MNETTETSNGMMLSGREWAALGALAVALAVMLPILGAVLERFDPGPDYRIPEPQSEDYWLFRRWAGRATRDADLLLIGDSVVWGAYVAPEETLSHYLGRGGARCANLGLPGGHPVALEGLLRHHGDAVRGNTVLLHCNPLWLSSPRHDLSEDKETRFNHPELVPQLSRRIPAYRADASRRLGIVARRAFDLSLWTRHLQLAHLGGSSVPSWLLDHPYESPLPAVLRGTASLPDSGEPDRRSWIERGIPRQGFDWVSLDASVQWAAFRRTVRLLRERDNRVIVLLGPFNEHILPEGNLGRYREVLAGMESWLAANHLVYLAPAPLPASLYADASHPLAAGYAQLARVLLGGGVLPEAEATRQSRLVPPDT